MHLTFIIYILFTFIVVFSPVFVFKGYLLGRLHQREGETVCEYYIQEMIGGDFQRKTGISWNVD